MLIKLNGAETNFIAKLRPDGDSWDLRCIDPLVGEFRLRPGDTLHFWSEQFGEWLPWARDGPDRNGGRGTGKGEGITPGRLR